MQVNNNSGIDLGMQVRDYRTTQNSAYKDEIAQLKAARQALTEAYKSGDKDAIEAGKQTISDIQKQMQANRTTLQTVHDDVKHLRELRQQLFSDVKAKNTDALTADRDAVAEQQAQVLTDIQA